MLDMNKTFKFGKVVYTPEQFRQRWCPEANDNKLEIVLKELETSGNLTWIESKTQEEKIFEKVAKEQDIINRADTLDELNEQAKQFKREEKRANQLKHKGMSLMFGNISIARDFEDWVTDELGLETEISFVKGQPKLTIYDITDIEANKVSRKYNLESNIQTAVGIVDTGITSATNAVDYTAEKVIAPVVRVGAKAVTSVGGTVVKTGVKTVGTLINAIVKGSKDCARELKNDEDVLRASRELITTKNEIKSSINKRVNSINSNNITFID